jgi:hypothetical protein
MLRTLSSVTLLLLGLACAGGEGGPPVVVRDSAGIRVVENHRAQWGEGSGWRVEAEPAISIGAVEGEEAYELSYVRSLTRLSDGRIAVANSGSHEVRLYDATGTHVQTIGRPGRGPGEFQNLDALYPLPGDSLLVVSSFGDRFSLFSPNGELVSIWYTTLSRTYGRFSDGTFLSMRAGTSLPPTTLGHVRDSVVYVSFQPRPPATAPSEIQSRTAFPAPPATEGGFNPNARDVIPVDTITRFVAGDYYRSELIMGNNRGIANESVPFGAAMLHAVHGDELFVSDGLTFEVSVFGRDGALRRIARLIEPREPLTPEVIEQWKEERLARTRNESQRAHAERVIAAQTFPDLLPALSALRTDSEGHLWAERFRKRPRDPQRWAVFDHDLRYLGTLETPAGFRIMEIGTDYLLGVWTDESDVEFVRLYGLLRSQ